MKRIILYFFLLMSFNLLTFNAFSQCEPMTPEQCPDPEDNGEVCPDSLEAAFINQFYSQVATIKPPAVYYMPPDSTQITLNHVKLIEVGNLPGGMSWQSNTPDSVFTAGEYYCVLLEGTPDSAGTFPLEITVDVYVLVFGVPVKAATVTDSTSLSINVIDNSGIGDNKTQLYVIQNVPNPFKDVTRIVYHSELNGQVEFEVYSLQGRKVFSQNLDVKTGENYVDYNGSLLAPGMYYYLFKTGGSRISGKMIRSVN